MWSVFAEICIAIGNILKKFIKEDYEGRYRFKWSKKWVKRN